MKHLALTFAATILFASSAFASHPGGGGHSGGVVVVIRVALCSTQRQQWAALVVARCDAAVAITVL
jgi:hypothetical protein